MADDGRLAPHAMMPALPLPAAHDLFQWLRRLEAANPQLPRLGRAWRAAHEPVRLGQAPSLAFAPGAVAAIARDSDSAAAPPRVLVNCFGTLGPNGPLPLHLTEYVRQRLVHHGDRALARFLDLFHHRMLCFFYRAWCDARPAVQHDRPQTDRFAVYLGALFGLGTPALRDRDALADHVKLFYAGRFVAQTGNAEGLQALIEDHFGMPAQIEAFCGEWAEIPSDCTWRLGRAGNQQRRLGRLGQSTHLGSRIWLRQSKFRIVLGPLTREQFEDVAPNGPRLCALAALVRGYVGDVLRWDLRLCLRRDAVPAFALGVGSQLARATWLRTAGTGVDDLVHEPPLSAALQHG